MPKVRDLIFKYGAGQGGGAAPVSWYLAGGVSAANVVAAYQPIGAASLAASYVNLANPGTYDLTAVAAPTFDTATGWAFDGLTQYLKTGVTPTDQNWTYIVRFSDAVQKDAADVIGRRSTDGFYVQITPCPLGSNMVSYRHGGGTNQRAAPRLAAGVLAIAGPSAYRNGVDDGVTLTNAAAVGVGDLWIGCMDKYGTTAESFFPGKVQAVAIYNTVLSQPQVAAITARMAALPL
jgi:hypothetical protein